MNDRLSDAVTRVQSQLAGLIASWTQSKRLYNLEGDGPVNDLMVEQFNLVDRISEPFVLQLTVLTLDAQLSPQALQLQRVTLTARLSDGSLKKHSGLVTSARQLGSDGGFQRLQLTVQPWVAMLAHGSHSRVWQHKSITQIIDDVLGRPYSSHAAWQWGEVAEDGSTEDLQAFLALGPNAGVRSYCVQYRETDLAFVQRLLAREGLGWRVEESDKAPSGHQLVFFADSTRWPQNITSKAKLGGAGIRFHRGAAIEQQDAIQSFGGLRQLNPASTAILQWDYQGKRAVASEAPTAFDFGSKNIQDMAAWLQHYEPAGRECRHRQLHQQPSAASRHLPPRGLRSAQQDLGRPRHGAQPACGPMVR
jgi:type VI secretion system secreted protein VgrG